MMAVAAAAHDWGSGRCRASLADFSKPLAREDKTAVSAPRYLLTAGHSATRGPATCARLQGPKRARRCTPLLDNCESDRERGEQS